MVDTGPAVREPLHSAKHGDSVALVVWIAIAIVVIAVMVRRRVLSARRHDLGSISDRWLMEHRTGRD